jgi:hypothetical protein
VSVLQRFCQKNRQLDSVQETAMVLVPLDPNDPQPRRGDERFGGDYKAFRKADKAWSERERNRRKRLRVAEPLNTEPLSAAQTEEPVNAKLIWDASCRCFRDAGGANWDHLVAGAKARAKARAKLRREQDRQEQVAAEAQAKQQEQDRDAAECHRLRLGKGERLLQEHVEQGARWRARDMAERHNRLAQLQGSEAAQNAEAGSVAVACGVRAVAEENPEWRRIQATYHRSYIPRGVPEHLSARVRFSMEIFRVGAQDLASEPVVLRLPDYRANRPSDCGCGSGDSCAANQAERLGHAPLAFSCGRNRDCWPARTGCRRCE